MVGSSVSLSRNSEVPRWLSCLLTEKFFNACIIHEDAKKNEKNIRRYVYHDVIRLVDADKLIDCSGVQSYTTNSAKVIFLNERPQTRAPRASGNLCITCDRKVQESSLFCSLSCKVQHILENGCKLSLYLRNCEFMSLPDPSLDDGQMTPDSVLEPAGSLRTESGSSSGGLAGFIDCPNLTCTATTEVVRKKRSNLSGLRTGCGPACKPVPEFTYGMMNRRKGTPHRSPLH
ncbi:hypothetical protein BUALT_Bualt01G0207800 [Buddleja alternifolia]|uniref:PLATZ transcription factor family protein n=1 Tax=Buddleja alternifolia TaxID=168488 RepID=A0AAV6Y9W1_9LAMI|nr:hypothetical protein BUALT_Bualt01G0207800 [Buddleja alternifolia]